MQVYSRWTEPEGTLGAIVREAEVRAEASLPLRGQLERACRSVPAGPSLAAALRGGTVALLTEVKRRSPSKGAIAEHLDAAKQACAYVRGGAAAISVLTEPVHFGGADADIGLVRAAVSVPVLKKDFHVATIQMVQARALGASAALVIARAVSPRRLADLMLAAADLGLETLVEVRDEDELERALNAGATVVGINNRNLETLVIDPETSVRLLPLIPASVVAIAESGVKSRADVVRYATAGADAVLVGSSISAAADPEAATKELSGVERRPRAG